MKKALSSLLSFLALYAIGFGQNAFDYTVQITPVNITNLPGLHSYAFAQSGGKWLVVGGRKDGLHARQPFNAFPESQNNTDLYVIDVNTTQFWTAPLSTLPSSMQEQLQSTNMNFYQDEDTLYVIGGYAYSATANDHITFPNLTTIQVSEVIDAVVNNAPFDNFFQQISDTTFAVTGGQLGKIGNTFYLVGGQRFDGRYNPMGNPTYTQSYTHQIRKFTIDNSGGQLSFANLTAITDPVHLRRRDYNLVPQIFPDGTPGYTISSGVFQLNLDLPFLYPVDITANGYSPITNFNQYLSNYHSAKVGLYDSTANNMHTLFFGGMSQYYYQNGNLVQDNLVPFVKTISRVSRRADSTLQEFQLPVEMPGLKGAGAEFIPNHALPHYSNEVVKLHALVQDTTLLGHIYGGISSSMLNPFSSNQTSNTNADDAIYEVWLIRSTGVGSQEIDGKNPFHFTAYPNPTEGQVQISYALNQPALVRYYIVDANGRLIDEGGLPGQQTGTNTATLSIAPKVSPQLLYITLVVDGKYFATQKVTKR